MKHLFIALFCLLFTLTSCAQIPTERPKILNESFDQKISRTISFTVPTMGVDELYETKEKVYILDAREREEFETSHIPNAQFIGYNKMEKSTLKAIPKDAKIVLYCSIGYRSEKMGEKIRKKGYTNVYNLYGSLFEWVNQGYPLMDAQGQPTKQVHTYNKKWSQWVEEGKAEKVW
ncbi:MAG: rhodanese-like domain-containing protein [Bacteroidota bacterium]